MTAAERVLLLLCSDLGAPDAKALTSAEYRTLRARLASLNDPELELGRRVLQNLGYDKPQRDRIMGLLERDPDGWLQYLEHRGISPLARVSGAYPTRLREALGGDAPLLLYSCGDRRLLDRRAISVVGSRNMHEAGRKTAQEAGRRIAELGLVLCTGGAAGVDTTAMEACLEAGGNVILYLPGEMEPTIRRYLPFINKNRVIVLSAAPTAHFHPGRAHQRNRWIHAHGSAVIVCQCTAGKGGSWRGAVENCRNHWSPVFVSMDDSEGSRDLLARGVQPLDWNALQNVLP